MLNIINPANNQLITSLESDDRKSVDNKFERLKNYNQRFSLADRQAGLTSFAHNLEKHQTELAQILSLEMGKPIKQALSEIKDTSRRTKFFIDNIHEVESTRVIKPGEEISFEPLGLVLCISAWNYPYFVSTNIILPALLAGCRVMFKPSELASMSGQKLYELLCQEQVFKHNLELVIGDKDIGEYLVTKNFNGIFFTGSERAGLHIKNSVGSRMIKTQFELGGKDAAYITDDVNLDHAVSSSLDGALYNCGQSCCSIERIYLHKNIAQEFQEKFLAQAKLIKPGDPSSPDTYLGPLTRHEQINFLLDQVADAQALGGILALGGKKLDGVGNYFLPTVILNANNNMKVMQEESFGPIVGIQVVNSDEEAISLINQSRFGLTGAVYTNDQKRAEHTLARLDVGTVYWNCCDKVSSGLPWSGRKNSGLGSTLSTIGMSMFYQPKAWYKAGPQ